MRTGPTISTRCPLCDAAKTTSLTPTAAGTVYRCNECDKTFLVPDRDPLANAPTMKKHGETTSLFSRR